MREANWRNPYHLVNKSESIAKGVDRDPGRPSIILGGPQDDNCGFMRTSMSSSRDVLRNDVDSLRLTLLDWSMAWKCKIRNEQ